MTYSTRMQAVWARPEYRAKQAARSFWTPERIERLRAMWAEGKSASTIAAELGCSRCAVLGKKHRLRLPERPADAWRHALGDRRQKQRPALKRVAWQPKPRQVHPRLDAPPEQVEPLHLDLLDLADGQCRWPYGDGPYTFCGHKTLLGRSYCAAHAAQAVRGCEPAAPDQPAADAPSWRPRPPRLTALQMEPVAKEEAA